MASKKRKARNRSKAEKLLRKLRKELGITTIEEVKQNEITRVLVLAKGDKQLTADLLGIGKTSVYRRLQG